MYKHIWFKKRKSENIYFAHHHCHKGSHSYLNARRRKKKVSHANRIQNTHKATKIHQYSSFGEITKDACTTLKSSSKQLLKLISSHSLNQHYIIHVILFLHSCNSDISIFAQNQCREQRERKLESIFWQRKDSTTLQNRCALIFFYIKTFFFFNTRLACLPCFLLEKPIKAHPPLLQKRTLFFPICIAFVLLNLSVFPELSQREKANKREKENNMFQQHKKPSSMNSHESHRPMCVQGDSGLVLTTDPKPRLRWTVELHERFVDAVTQLGGPDSTFQLLNLHSFSCIIFFVHICMFIVINCCEFFRGYT